MKSRETLPGTRRLVYLGAAAILCLVVVGVIQAQTYINCPNGFGIGLPVVPPILVTSLQGEPNPVFPPDPVTFLPTLRKDLKTYIANPTVAIQLGKALFWDMQAGSDNKTACATCHNHAGADVRTTNQVNPGPVTNTNDAFIPNLAVHDYDYPLTVAHPQTDNVVGSQGVRKSQFGSVNSKSGAESTTAVSDPIFNVNGVNVRQVTGKNTPSMINAVFNHRNFWNGRAQPEFNGVNPFGGRDTSLPMIWVLNSKGTPVQSFARIPSASLASQAVGPALNDVEMSASGRSFLDLGRKMLLVKPLGLQKVDPGDSVLGGIADRSAGKGLTVSYKSLIQTAFQPAYWDSNKTVTINGKSYSMMEANFSLYWGLAIMLYESTLVSDQSPMDQYLAVVGTTRPGPGSPTASVLQPLADRLVTQEYGYTRGVAGILNGLNLFEQPLPPAGKGRECTACHLGANLTSASVANLVNGGVEVGDVAFKMNGFDLRMERMFMQVPPVPTDLLSIINNAVPSWFTTQAQFNPSTYGVTVTSVYGVQDPATNAIPTMNPPAPVPVTVYDAGWYNIGVRPTSDDTGLGGKDPWGNFLSWTQLFQNTDPSSVKVPGGALTCVTAGNATFPTEVLNSAGFPMLSGPLLASEPNDVAGTFKVASLRNSELQGPYFHNGGKSTLMQVMDFYDKGGDFANNTLSPFIRFYGFLSSHGHAMTDDEQKDLVAFLVSLTDDRVRYEKAPFDHPQLLIPNGAAGDPSQDATITIDAVGAGGLTAPLARFLNLNPFAN